MIRLWYFDLGYLINRAEPGRLEIIRMFKFLHHLITKEKWMN